MANNLGIAFSRLFSIFGKLCRASTCDFGTYPFVVSEGLYQNMRIRSRTKVYPVQLGSLERSECVLCMALCIIDHMSISTVSSEPSLLTLTKLAPR